MASYSAPVLGVAVHGRCALPGCTRPVHVDPGTGIAHDYCGRSHAQEAQGTIQAPHGACHTCQLPGCHEPVHYEADVDRVHEYCSLTHARDAQAQGLAPPSNRQRQGQSTPHNRCSLPGCSAPRYADPSTGFRHDFCGRTHARDATVGGMLPYTAAGGAPAGVDRVWRGRAGEPAYVLSVLTNAHPKYEGVKQQFRDAWRHPSPTPTVMRVLQVRNPAHVHARYTALASRVSNEQRRFHGTSLEPGCSFGIDVTQRPCTHPGCSVCTICSGSFDLQLAGSRARYSR